MEARNLHVNDQQVTLPLKLEVARIKKTQKIHQKLRSPGRDMLILFNNSFPRLIMSSERLIKSSERLIMS